MKLLTSGNSCIQLPYAHMLTVVQVFTFEIFSIIANFLHRHATKFIAIVMYYYIIFSSIIQFSPIHINLGILIRKVACRPKYGTMYSQNSVSVLQVILFAYIQRE